MNFFESVYKIVKTIPCGKVMTYGQIASIISSPRATRVVDFAMRAAVGKNIPWQRVVNSHGIINIVNPIASKKLQGTLLRKEGIKITMRDENYYIDLKKYLYQPKTLK